MIVGLTGGTGSGKSLVAAFLSQMGFEVIDYDKVTHEIYTKGSDCLREITDAFGKNILNPDGGLNRKKLGEVVFSDPNALDTLNKIVYKYILAYTKDAVENSRNKLLLLDAPTLFESGLNKKCDKIIGVIADRELRIKRIEKRDSLCRKHILDRINSQKPDEFYKENCDYIIENNHSREELLEKTRIIFDKLKE